MTYDPEELRDLIPLYLNGTLSESEQREFESSIEEFPEVQRELQEFSEIKGIYNSVRDELPKPSEAVFDRIMKTVKEKTRVPGVSEELGLLEKLRSFFETTFASPRVSWAVVAAQCAVILFLVLTLPRQDQFTTLTSSQVELGEGVTINIVFDPEARERDIRGVLNQFQASWLSR